MNHYSMETIVKDKIKSAQQEGMANQAFYRSGKQKFHPMHKVPRMIFLSLFVLGLLNWLWQ
jgi:hypothetical protein